MAGVLEALPKCTQTVRVRVRRLIIEKPDHRHPRLLRARRNRPRCRRAPEQRDELAPPDHSITSSARTITDGGIRRPSAFAVLAFTASSNLVGCSNGRFSGFEPLRILTTMVPLCRHMAARDGPYEMRPPASACSFHW